MLRRRRLADGSLLEKGQRLPGEVELWLVGERRRDGQIRYYVSNLPETATLLREYYFQDSTT